MDAKSYPAIAEPRDIGKERGGAKEYCKERGGAKE
jgi:hypothetical protein